MNTYRVHEPPTKGRSKGTALEHQAQTILLGLPYHMNGTEGASAGAVRRLGGMLEEEGLAVQYLDERMSSE